MTELRIELGAARDQGPRPTCLSFALSEIHRVAIGFEQLLSPESLHQRACLLASKPKEAGLTVLEAADSLNQNGQTTELAWPYNIDSPIEPGCTFHRAKPIDLKFLSQAVVDRLLTGSPISLIIDIDSTFFVCDGITPLALLSRSQVQGRHAVVICGIHRVHQETHYFIKNSWGASWGSSGYAWLTEEYVLGRSPQLIWI